MTSTGITIRPIRTEQDHDEALKRIDKLMSAEYGTPEGDELDMLVTLVDAYETKHFPMDAPDPVSAMMTGKRQLTLAMIRRVRSGLGISADLLVGTGKVKARRRG
jgi:HTH-type transcriptional regulator/antitoxin HigA